MSDITKENEVLRMMVDDDVEMCVYDGSMEEDEEEEKEDMWDIVH